MKYDLYLIIGSIGLLPLIFIFYYAYVFLFRKNARIWGMSYLRFRKAQKKAQKENKGNETKHIIFLFVDHYEPYNGKAARHEAWERVKYWLNEYPKLVKEHRDSDGRPPQHTWFFPCEQELTFLSDLSKLCFRGFGEIEIHLHHHNDTSERLTQRLEHSKQEFGKRGATITAEQKPKNYFGFIHGNWALDNSHPKGLWCGVNDEISILQKSACYGDFTLPSAPNPTQTKKINSIYYAKDNPKKPKSHNDGTDAKVGFRNQKDFLIVQGPLQIYRSQANGRFMPVIDNGEIAAANPPTKQRIDKWIDTNIHVKGRPEWIFVKVHTHGAHPKNRDALFGSKMQEMFDYLESKYNDGTNYKLHYASTREAYNIIKAAEDNKPGDPGIYRDYIIPPYANTRILSNVLFELVSYSKTWLEMKNLQPHRRCQFLVKKGQLEKIEGHIANFKLIRDFANKKLVLTIYGSRKIFFSVRTPKYVKQVENGQVVRKEKMRGFFITTISSYLKYDCRNEIVIHW